MASGFTATRGSPRCRGGSRPALQHPGGRVLTRHKRSRGARAALTRLTRVSPLLVPVNPTCLSIVSLTFQLHGRPPFFALPLQRVNKIGATGLLTRGSNRTGAQKMRIFKMTLAAATLLGVAGWASANDNATTSDKVRMLDTDMDGQVSLTEFTGQWQDPGRVRKDRCQWRRVGQRRGNGSGRGTRSDPGGKERYACQNQAAADDRSPIPANRQEPIDSWPPCNSNRKKTITRK